MSLFDRAVDLQLKLEVAQTADTGLDLLARAARLFEMLSDSANYLEGATRFRQAMSISDRPAIDVKAVTQAVSAFRAGLSRHGSAAFQHQPASTLTETAKSQRDRCSRWLDSRWRQEFAAYEAAMDRVASERLSRSGSHAVVAQARAAKLRALRGLDPITQHDDITKALETNDVARWRAAIAAVGDQLVAALGALDAEHAALTPEVRAVLDRAATENGMPLDELTPELLAALRAAGVDGRLVVRRL
jgi:hypothetical protein